MLFVNPFFGRLSRFLTSRKWEWMVRLKLNNLKINQFLRPANDSELGELSVPMTELNFSMRDYDRFINAPILSQYRKFSYPHSKPLEYLTTATLLNLSGGESILDAAGGSDAEYIHALTAFTGLKLKVYCQDALLEGQVKNDITYVGGQIDAISLPNQSLDGITCHHSFEHFQQDLDIKFIHEALRLLRVGGKLIIAPLFITNESAEIWNRKPPTDTVKDGLIVDYTASFAGWGPYEGFARTYSPKAFKERIIGTLPECCSVQIVKILLDGNPVPDIEKNCHQPLLNGHMKALVITKLESDRGETTKELN